MSDAVVTIDETWIPDGDVDSVALLQQLLDERRRDEPIAAGDAGSLLFLARHLDLFFECCILAHSAPLGHSHGVKYDAGSAGRSSRWVFTNEATVKLNHRSKAASSSPPQHQELFPTQQGL